MLGRSDYPRSSVAKFASDPASLFWAVHYTVRRFLIGGAGARALVQGGGGARRNCRQAIASVITYGIGWRTPVASHDGLQSYGELLVLERSRRDGGVAVLIPIDPRARNPAK